MEGIQDRQPSTFQEVQRSWTSMCKPAVGVGQLGGDVGQLGAILTLSLWLLHNSTVSGDLYRIT